MRTQPRQRTMTGRLHSVRVGCTCALLALIVSLPQGRPAAQGDPLPRVIPYDGVVEVAGGPVTGDVAMRFSLYLEGGAPAIWTEEWSDGVDRSCAQLDDCFVRGFGGRFSVALGTYADIEPQLLATDSMELGLSVRVDETWIELSGRQRIVPVPYAYWSTAAEDLTVTQDVRVVTELVAQSVILETLLAVSGDLTASGSVLAYDDVISEGAIDLPDDVEDLTIYSGTGTSVHDVEAALATGGSGGAFGYDDGTVERTALVSDSDIYSVALNTASVPDAGVLAPEFPEGVRFDGHVAVASEPFWDQGNGYPVVPGLLTAWGDVTLGDVSFGGRLPPDTPVTATACDPSSPDSPRCVVGDAPLMLHRYVEMGSQEVVELTGVDANVYHCWVGGVAFMGTAFSREAQNDVLLRYHLERPIPDLYHVRADLATNDLMNREHRHVGVVCLQRGLLAAQTIDWPSPTVAGLGTCSTTRNACDDNSDCTPDPVVLFGGCAFVDSGVTTATCVYGAAAASGDTTTCNGTTYTTCDDDSECAPGQTCGGIEIFGCETSSVCHTTPIESHSCPSCPTETLDNACVVCGDGIVHVSEACDDGNDIDTDTCSNTCEPQATCVDDLGDDTHELCSTDEDCAPVQGCREWQGDTCSCELCDTLPCPEPPAGRCYWGESLLTAPPTSCQQDQECEELFECHDGSACHCAYLTGSCESSTAEDLGVPCAFSDDCYIDEPSCQFGGANFPCTCVSP